jgi:hypothetical protein
MSTVDKIAAGEIVAGRMKVWICTNGEYSDYHIVGVYTNEATARRVSEAYGWNEPEGRWEVDPAVPSEIVAGMSRYGVSIWADNGDVAHTWITDAIVEDRWLPEKRTVERGTRMREGILGTIRCWARDKDHAIKIAGERRIAWKLAQDAANAAQGAP